MRDIPSLFRGREDVHGYYGLLNQKATDRGKKVGQAATRRRPVTPELWADHLSGKARLGIVPVLKDGKCWWFCVDVDNYQDEGLHEQLAARIQELALPLVMTRSKSGGAHLWCFLSEPMPAAQAIKAAESFKKRLGLPEDHVDIFPAQGKASDVGNWMNMPYFGDQCHGCGIDGLQSQTVEDFVKYANERTVHPDDLKVARKGDRTTVDSGLPPCVDHFLAEGIPDGARNNILTHIGVAFKRAYPDDWEERLHEANQEMADPPLDRSDMRQICKSLKSHELQYFCAKVSEFYCDKEACKKRAYGIGRGPTSLDDGALPIDSIVKLEGEKPIYKITSSTEVIFKISLEELFYYQKFRMAFLGATDIYLPNMKADEWTERLNGYLEKMHTEQQGDDTQMGDRVVQLFKRFGERSVTSSLKEALERGLPFYDGSRIVFRGDDFMQMIDRSLKLEREKTWWYMRQAGTQLENRLWVYPVQGELWFNPDEGEQA
jgi:hypothetical protein